MCVYKKEKNMNSIKNSTTLCRNISLQVKNISNLRFTFYIIIVLLITENVKFTTKYN